MLSTDKLSRKLQRVKITLLRNPNVALLSGVLMVGKTYVDEDTPTARTDGRNDYFGAKFISELSEQELAFVVMHEAMHKMYRHLTTWRKLYDENPRLANMACDYVINLQLRDLDPTESFMAMPRGKDGELMGLLDEQFRGMNAKQVFDLLKQRGGRGGGGGDEGDGPVGFDEHDWDGASQGNEESKREFERELDQAVRQGLQAAQKAKGKGSGAGGLELAVAELLKPKVDWREQLREFVKSVCTGRDKSSWRRPNRRFLGEDVYMPTLISEQVERIVLAIDTSGSIGASELRIAMSEFAGICEQVNPKAVDLLYWGTSVVAHEVYNEATVSSIVESTRPVSGGGTAPSCVSTYLKDNNIKPDITIVMTDGVVGNDWGSDWPSPVLWCIINNDSAEASIGTTIHVTGD